MKVYVSFLSHYRIEKVRYTGQKSYSQVEKNFNKRRVIYFDECMSKYARTRGYSCTVLVKSFANLNGIFLSLPGGDR